MKSAALALVGLVAALTTACSGDTASSGALGATTGEGDRDWPFAVEEVDRFDEPWAMAFLPDGDLLVTERSGTLHLRDADSGERIEVAGTPSVLDSGQSGLGDVLPGPSYAQDGLVYLSWAEQGDGGVGAAVGRGRLELSGDRASLADLEVIWRQTPSISPGSLLIYGGDLFEDWEGDAFLGALSGEALVHVDLDGESSGEAEVFDMGQRIRAVEEGPDGAIWLLEDEGSGRLLRLTPASAPSS